MKREQLAWIIGLSASFSLVIPGGLTSDGRMREARADEAPATVTGPTCKLKGSAPLKKGVQLFDASNGGRAIANFTGAVVPMTISEIPADPTSGRAKLSTVDGQPNLRLEGYLAADEVEVYTSRDISVVGAQVWISSGQKIKLVSATADSLRAERSIAGTASQTVRGSAACDAFTLKRTNPVKMDIAGNARGYMMKKSSIDLYDKPNGDAIFTLKMMEGSAQIFWSTEIKAGFVHILGRSDVTIDAWARWKDLEALKKGEMVDQYIPPTTGPLGAQFGFEKPPPLVKSTKDIPVRARRDEKEKPIGVIETGAEVYVMETVAGWTNVLPKSLGMTPPDGGGFWIPAAEAPK